MGQLIMEHSYCLNAQIWAQVAFTQAPNPQEPKNDMAAYMAHDGLKAEGPSDSRPLKVCPWVVVG
jgi:hypothetical protein